MIPSQQILKLAVSCSLKRKPGIGIRMIQIVTKGFS